MEKSNFIDYNNVNFSIIVRARIVNDNLILTFFNEFEETLEKNEMNLILFHSIKKNKSFNEICRFVKHMRHHLMLKGFIAILLFFCC